MTPTQAARALCVSDQIIRKWADAGRLAHLRTPLGRLISRADVERLAETRAPTHGRAPRTLMAR